MGISFRIVEIGVSALERYASIPMKVEVRSIFRIEPAEVGVGFAVCEEAVEPYIKDYDEDGGSPVCWADDFDVSRWGFFVAEDADGGALGAAAVAYNTNGVHMLEGRSDLGVLWDIRVKPEAQGCGVGRALVAHSAAWLRARECRWLKIETQNVNVGACRFYQSCGCTLGAIHRFAYAKEPTVAHEAMLLWYLAL